MGNLMTFMQRLKMFMKRKENRSKFNKDKFLSDSDKEKFEQLKQTFNSATFSDETRKAFKKAISELIPVISDESKLLILDEYMFYMDFKDISILLDSISSDEIRAEILKKHVMSLSPSQRLSLAEPISSNDLFSLLYIETIFPISIVSITHTPNIVLLFSSKTLVSM